MGLKTTEIDIQEFTEIFSKSEWYGQIFWDFDWTRAYSFTREILWLKKYDSQTNFEGFDLI